MIAAIIREATQKGVYCDERIAAGLVDTITREAAQLREAGPDAVYYFSEPEMRLFHGVLDVVVPDDQAAAVGSAHARLNRYALGGGQIGSSVVHTRRYRDDEAARDRTIKWCAVYVGFHTV